MIALTCTPAKKTFIPGGVFALGNFDGVHRGHQALIKSTLDYARHHEVPARVLTFEPHPRFYFEPTLPPFRLTPAAIKNDLLLRYGIDEIITLPFDKRLASMTAEEFYLDLLQSRLGARHLIAGFDFVFGAGRAGNVSVLRNMLMKDKLEMTEVAPLRDGYGEIISATRLRTLLQEGDVAAAALLLGRPWSITGVVVQGALRGRTLNFPTANIRLNDYLRPKLGVYAVRARQRGSSVWWDGVANIGVRPTVEQDGEVLLEFHLFGFHHTIYGEDWDVELHHFIRQEAVFSDLSMLKKQIVADVEKAKNLLFRTESLAIGPMEHKENKGVPVSILES